MKHLHFFQHVSFENLGIIESWAHHHDFSVSSTQFYKDQSISMPEDTDWLVVMGGPMGVYDDDEFPWLSAEKAAIAQAIGRGNVVLGICLGAQLVAQVLGSGVRANAYKEIGWFPVYLDSEALAHPICEALPNQWDAFHWHGDTFDIPDGGRLLARTSACRNQGFVYNDRVVGMQFHMEVTRSGAADLVENCAADLIVDEFVSTQDQILSPHAPFEESHKVMTNLLDYLNEL
jgi:GMP synthase-like glutamine amidotransferase